MSQMRKGIWFLEVLKMRVVVKTNNLTKEEWLKYRTHGIGGSDVSVIAGINPYKSVYQLWLEKTQQVQVGEDENDFIHFGTLLEPIVRKEFTLRTGIKVRQKHMLLQSEENPFMFADLDGVINDNGELCIFEAKTASAYKQEIWEEGVPAEYILQVQHYMAVTGAKMTYIAAIVGGNHFFYHIIERDDELIGKIIAMEKEFWNNYVLNGIEPPVDGSEATTKYINDKFCESNGTTIELPESAICTCEQYEKLREQIKELENARNTMANQLKQYLGEAEKGTVGDRTISWKTINKKSLDTKRLREDNPQVYKKYLTQSSYRRFMVA